MKEDEDQDDPPFGIDYSDKHSLYDIGLYSWRDGDLLRDKGSIYFHIDRASEEKVEVKEILKGDIFEI